ncbi:MAG TPA: hypothetical protein VNJ51_06675 [Candidatus Dormibacteraeota bacterium]|nr:hypothetical protein [Candidatus Dormibacteraeota bacterium]
MGKHGDTYAVFWPRGERALKPHELAPRFDNLSGKTVAFVWDYLFRGDEIFSMLERGLQSRFPDMRFVGYEAFGSTHGADEHAVVAGLPDKLRALGVDAVVSGIGC